MKRLGLWLLTGLMMAPGACMAEETVRTDIQPGMGWEYEQIKLPEVDFDKLHEQNPDIYAWICIPDTVISYPILRSGPDLEEDYYLNHTVDHAAGYPGSIFTELYNEDDFTDVNTVIYGHNMRDGSMFGSLAAYKNPDYMLEHPEIYICTQEGWFAYQIACSVVVDDRHPLFTYEFGTYQAFDLFLDALYEEPVYKEECVYALERDDYDPLRDTLITLVTCVSGNRPENRLFVVGRLIAAPEDARSRMVEKRLELVREYIEESFGRELTDEAEIVEPETDEE